MAIDKITSPKTENQIAAKINELIDGKQDTTTAVTHTASTAVGNSTTPVYIASTGVATALSFTIAKSVPSDAVFTDTNTLMTQDVSTTNATYPLLACPTADATANQGAKTGIFASGIKINPSTNNVSATSFTGSLTGTADVSKKVLLFPESLTTDP